MYKIEDYIRNSSLPIIYVCSSQYNSLLALIFILLYGEIDKSYVIMFSPDKNELAAFGSISLEMRNNNINNIVIDKRTKFHRAIGISEILNQRIKKQIFREMNISGGDYFLVNFSWNSCIVLYPASIYFKHCASAIFVEEGATQYVTPRESELVLLLKNLYGNQRDYWGDKRIKDVFLQYPDKYQNIPINVKKFSLNDYVSKLSKKHIDTIIGIYGTGVNLKGIKREIEDADGVIFTQPLSEDGYISEEEKVRIYDDLVRYYSQFGRLVVKIHPRDTANYEFSNASVLPKEFPSELLCIIGKKFDFAVALCSSAAETINARKKINLNENYLSEMTYTLQDIRDC